MSKYQGYADFMNACGKGEVANALAVLKEGFVIPEKDTDTATNRKKFDKDEQDIFQKNLNRALVWAIEVGDKGLVETLLDTHNADIHHISGEKRTIKGGKPTEGRTVLQICLDRVDLTKQDDPYVDMAFSLLSKMKDISRVNPRDLKKCFLLAAREGRSDIIDKVLLSHRVSANSQDNASSTALMIAAREGHTEVVKSLLGCQDVLATLNAQNDAGMTALMFAAQNGHGKVVTQLLEAGALTDVQTWDGKTAQEMGNDTTKQLIADHIATQEAKKREAEEKAKQEAEERVALENKVKQLEAERGQEQLLLEQVAQLTAERDAANEKVSTLEGKVTQLTTERDAANKKVEALEKGMEEVLKRLEALEQERNAQSTQNTETVVETVTPGVEPKDPNAVGTEGEGAEGVDPKTSAPVVSEETPTEESKGPYANICRRFNVDAGQKGDHKSIMKRAQKHNRSDIRKKGKHAKGTFRSEEEYQQALATIRQMEEQGLLPKGPNGESNAEFYLWKLRLVLKYGLDEGDLKKSALGQVPGVQAMNGQYLSTEHLTSPGAVFSALCTGEMNGKNLENVAQVLMNTERLTTAFGNKSRSYVRGSDTRTSVQCVQDETVASPSLQTRLESATQAGQVAAAEKTGLKSRLGAPLIGDVGKDADTAKLTGNEYLV